jgi:4-amino-4-deoxy-L-arabinose transferase-like glycosyltransferase
MTQASDVPGVATIGSVPALDQRVRMPGLGVRLALIVAWVLLAGLALRRGPALSDHEVIVAQIARQSLADRQWLVPHYLDTPFLMKPPLAPWLVGATASLFPAQSAARAVDEFSARLPSAVATLLTSLLLWRLGASMFGRRMGLISAFAYMTSVGALLYAFNATAEAVLTLFCTWAYAEFWWSRQSAVGTRFLHQLKFYIALSLAMLAKGPMPLAVVCVPIAVYWWMDRPTRRMIIRGPGCAVDVIRQAPGESLRRLKQALMGLGLWWGVPLFLMIFLPWFFLVARTQPYVWTLWNYEYLDRLQGNYPGVRSGEYFYYIPIAFGLVIPWALSMPEALFAPFLRAYRSDMRPLVYVWYWVMIALLISSLMSFKKPYYILPAMPGIALLLTPVLHRFFFVRGLLRQEGAGHRDAKRWADLMTGAMVALGGAFVIVAWFVARKMFPEEWKGQVLWAMPLLLMTAVAGFAWATRTYVRGRRTTSFLSVGGTCALTFVACWSWMGPRLGNIDAPSNLVKQLDAAGVSREAPLYWASNRPDGRVVFYCGRNLIQLLDPYKLISEQRGSKSGDDLREMVGGRICELLKGPRHVYFVFQRGDFEALMAFFRPPARELLSIDRGKAGRDKDDWVVATNEGVTAL